MEGRETGTCSRLRLFRALLLAWALPRALTQTPALRAGASAIIVSQAFHLVVWIRRNALVP